MQRKRYTGHKEIDEGSHMREVHINELMKTYDLDFFKYVSIGLNVCK